MRLEMFPINTTGRSNGVCGGIDSRVGSAKRARFLPCDIVPADGRANTNTAPAIVRHRQSAISRCPSCDDQAISPMVIDGNGRARARARVTPRAISFAKRRESSRGCQVGFSLERSRPAAARVLHRVSNEPRAVLFTAVALTFINFERARCHIST